MGPARTHTLGGRLLLAAVGTAAAAAGGCGSTTWFRNNISEPVERFVTRGGNAPADPSGGRDSPDFVNAHTLFREERYAAAESLFHKVAENTHNSPQVGEEARFYEAECLYKLDRLPAACDTYNKMLIDFPAGTHRDQAVRRMFDIANYWLDDTRGEMTAYREKAQGQRWLVVPAVFHMEKKKPFLDQEGRALQALEQVHLNDVTGPLADKALFLAGGVKFFRQDYREADHYFSQVVEHHPNSPMAPEAVRLAIISKHMSTGGPDYDGRKVAEARLMVDTALRAYPELAQKESGFLERQLGSIALQEAQKDLNTAEFYRRTGHPGSAFFYYEIVRRRYPGTKAADLAVQGMEELRDAVEREKARDPSSWERMWNGLERMFAKRPKSADDESTAGDAASPFEGPTSPPKPLPAEMLPR